MPKSIIQLTPVPTVYQGITEKPLKFISKQNG